MSFACIITRSAYPCDVLAIAHRLRSICLRSIKSRTDLASGFGAFRTRHRARMTKLLLIDTSGAEFKSSREAYERIFNVAKCAARNDLRSGWPKSADLSTRPALIALKDKRSRLTPCVELSLFREEYSRESAQSGPHRAKIRIAPRADTTNRRGAFASLNIAFFRRLSTFPAQWDRRDRIIAP